MVAFVAFNKTMPAAMNTTHARFDPRSLSKRDRAELPRLVEFAETHRRPCLRSADGQEVRLPQAVFDVLLPPPPVGPARADLVLARLAHVPRIAAQARQNLDDTRAPFARLAIETLGDIDTRLATLAKELDAPIVCLSQLNRECEKRPDKRPQIADLRESGAIEQDAHGVVFLHREEEEGETQVINGQHRRGPKGRAFLDFKGRTTSFEASRKEPLSLNGTPLRTITPLATDNYADFNWNTP
jgi:hypothetical protein